MTQQWQCSANGGETWYDLAGAYRPDGVAGYLYRLKPESPALKICPCCGYQRATPSEPPATEPMPCCPTCGEPGLCKDSKYHYCPGCNTNWREDRRVPRQECAALTDRIDLMRDEFKRILAISGDNAEVAGLCERAVKNITQHVHVIDQRDVAERERDQWKAKAEKAEQKHHEACERHVEAAKRLAEVARMLREWMDRWKIGGRDLNDILAKAEGREAGQ